MALIDWLREKLGLQQTLQVNNRVNPQLREKLKKSLDDPAKSFVRNISPRPALRRLGQTRLPDLSDPSNRVNRYFQPTGEVRARDFVREVGTTVRNVLQDQGGEGKRFQNQVSALNELRKKSGKPELSASEVNRMKRTFIDPVGIAGSTGNLGIGKVIKGLKPRGFIETVQKADGTPSFIKKKVSEIDPQTYAPKPLKPAMNKAAKDTGKDYQASLEEFRNTPGWNQRVSSLGQKLVQRNIADGRIDDALDILEDIDVRSREAGQGIQALSAWTKLTPEGMVRFAQRQVDKYNLNAKVKIPKLQGETAKDLAAEAKRIQTMAPGRAQQLAHQKLMETISDLTPSPFWKKAIALWKAGLLTGVKTTGVNLTSNTTMGAAEVVKDIPATLVDSVASLFTKKRTKTLSLGGGGTKEGFKRGADYLVHGYDERNIGRKFDYFRVNFGKSKFAKGLQAYEESVFRLMGAADQPFYYGAKARSLKDQAGAAAKNQRLTGADADEFIKEFISNPPDEAVKISTRDALVATFQNETQLGKLAENLGNTPIGEILAPFRRTPAAITTSLLNYTPVGIAKTIIENAGKGRFDQRLFSQGIGRGLTGTAVLAIGASLFKKGLITGPWPKDEKERSQWELEGKQANSIKINGKWRSLGTLGVPGMVLGVGGYYEKGREESGSPTQAVTSALAGLGKLTLDQTYLRGIKSVIDAIDDPVRYAGNALEQTVGSVIPTFVADIARSTDPQQREVNNVGEALRARFPGLRTGLLPRRDAFGEGIPRPTNALQTFADPFRPSDVRQAPNIPMEALPSKTKKKQTVGGQEISLNPKELDALEKAFGPQVRRAFDQVISDPNFTGLNDEQKIKVLKSVTDDLRAVTRLESLADKLEPQSLGKAFDDLTKDQRLLLTNPDRYFVEIPKVSAQREYSTDQLQKIKTALGNSDSLTNFILSFGNGGNTKKAGFTGLKIPKIKKPKVKRGRKLRSRKVGSTKRLKTLKIKAPKTASVRIPKVDGRISSNLRGLTLRRPG